MTEQEFLEHHGLTRNPFADEDAQTDAVFKDYCIESTFHPAWSKAFGDPSEPATAIVLGPKGSGKTAMRLQMVRHLQSFNREHPDRRVFFVQYDDFNSYLGPLQQTMPGRAQDDAERVLGSIRTWDHIDAILCQSMTSLIDKILSKSATADPDDGLSISHRQLGSLDRSQKRDLLLLAALYDQSREGTYDTRWHQLRRLLRFTNFPAWRYILIGANATIIALLVAYYLVTSETLSVKTGIMIGLLMLVAGWIPFMCRAIRHAWLSFLVTRHIRVSRRDWLTLMKILMQFPASELAAQPIPTARRSDDRYAMLEKLQIVLRGFEFRGLIVLIDRVDEPDLVNGRPERIRSLVWPLLDNKLLKHPGLGLKLLLPSDLQYYLDRESREFNERARLDKQNFIANFEWTGEALYDLVVARMKACGKHEATPSPAQLLDSSISEQRLILAMQSLKTPRTLFRFLYRLIAEHCKKYRSVTPQFKISSETFEATLAVFQSDLMRAAAAP